MTAAVAVGVTSTFGAPLGGVLYAVEVSCKSFTVNNLWKSIFASTITILLMDFYKKYRKSESGEFLSDASYLYNGTNTPLTHEMVFAAGLGVLCGVIGSNYVSF